MKEKVFKRGATLNKGTKAAETEEFLRILNKHFEKMNTAPRRIDVWQEILVDCQQKGILIGKNAKFLYRTRWPALTRAALNKWTKKQTLNCKDKMVVELCRITNPMFCKEKAPEIVDANDEYESCFDDTMDNDFDEVDHSSVIFQEGDVKDAVEYMVSIVCDCQDIVESMLDDAASITVDHQHSSLSSSPISSNSIQSSSFCTFDSLRLPFPPLFPTSIMSPDLEKAQIDALKAYALNCRWSTYKIQLEVAALKKP